MKTLILCSQETGEEKNLLYCFCICQAGDDSHVLAVLIVREHSVQRQTQLADASQ